MRKAIDTCTYTFLYLKIRLKVVFHQYLIVNFSIELLIVCAGFFTLGGIFEAGEADDGCSGTCSHASNLSFRQLSRYAHL